MKALALVAAVGMVMPAGAWAVSDAAVQACIARNGPRYDAPADAVAAQYVDLAAACRAKLAREGGATIATTGSGAIDGPGGTGQRADTTPVTRPVTARERAEAAAVLQRTITGQRGDTASPLDGVAALPWPFWAFFVLVAACIVAVGPAQWRRK